MSRARKVTIAVGLVVLAIVIVVVVLLERQGLNRASQWVTVAGFFVSTVIGIAGLILAVLTLRQAGAPPPQAGQGVQVVKDTQVGGSITQIQGVGGDVDIGQ